ncbi:MAG: hypothetical protein EXQ58_12465, partial [Acidobacteria bacterium]|nr:hypothetical protein [Acidobacteriota bacterium]
MSSRHSAILNMRAGCDGAPEMWNLLEEGFIPQFGDNLHRLVDLHHLMEKLGAAARVIDDSKAAGERLRRWKMSLLNRASAATGILEELTASGLDEGVGEDHPAHAAITYLESHSIDSDRMNYARAWLGAWQWQRGGHLQKPIRNPHEALRRTMEGGDGSAHPTDARPRP